jgi:hypothetical protein
MRALENTAISILESKIMKHYMELVCGKITFERNRSVSASAKCYIHVNVMDNFTLFGPLICYWNDVEN